MIEIHLYGSLRRHAPNSRPDRESVARLEPQPDETVGMALERLGILPDEISHIFLNGTLLFTRNSMAPWLKYQESHSSKGLDTPMRAGDRLGLFARDMGLLVI